MEAGTILRDPFVPTSFFRRQSLLPRFVTVVSRAICFSLPHSVLKLTVSCSQKENGLYRGPKPRKDWAVDWVPQNESTVRRLPIYVGGASLLAVLLNRAVSGIAPVVDAGSSQSRADLLALGLSVTNILTGLVWLSIRAKTISVVNPEGVECRELHSNLPEPAVSELMWAWESLSTATCCRSLVVIYDGKKILQIGVAALSPAEPSEPMAVDAEKLMQGTLYQGVMRSKAQNYLANLALYPGKSELPFLPTNTQAVILQPLGDKGIAIIGGDTIRGFTTSDQTWIAYIGEKLDATLAKLIGGSSLPVEEIIC